MLPSEITLKSCGGFRRNVFEGWKKLISIEGEGYKVEFYRLSERTIDTQSDALNSWYNIWTWFCCEFTDSKGKLSLSIRNPEDADKIYKILSDVQPVTFEHEGTLSAAEVARTSIEAIARLL